MEILTEALERDWYRSKAYDEYFGGLRTAVIDIETTGLYPGSSQMILGGILERATAASPLRQFFAEDPAEEPVLLTAYHEALTAADVLVSYNGNGFDLPFLRQRMEFYGLPYQLDKVLALDLYRAAHLYSGLRGHLPNLKQKTLESYLGVSDERSDAITGQDSVRLYMDYLRDRDPDQRRRILLHNRDDLAQLAALLRLFDKLDLHRILFHEGFAVTAGGGRAVVRQIAIGKQALAIQAATTGLPIDYYSFAPGYQAVHRSVDGALSLEIPFRHHGNALYLDTQEVLAGPDATELAPYCIDGYLVLQEGHTVRHREINRVVRLLLRYVLTEIAAQAGTALASEATFSTDPLERNPHANESPTG